jgi:CheY-like chemotaxis protein
MSIPKAKLLVVDDEPSTLDLFRQIFVGLGHPVRVAEDGFSALEQIREEVPDILLSDLNMPGMSGFELLSVVRRRIPNIYVIATSGAFSGDTVPHGIAADAFHEKATGLGGLFDIVKTAPLASTHIRAGSNASTPIWISPSRSSESSRADVLITCPECLRAFSLSVGAADFVIHEANCVYCDTIIHYATVQAMNPALPHRFHPQPPKASSFLSAKLAARETASVGK